MGVLMVLIVGAFLFTVFGLIGLMGKTGSLAEEKGCLPGASMNWKGGDPCSGSSIGKSVYGQAEDGSLWDTPCF